ncbi:hypothetical protein B5807_06522 [Epicoccum nigrum]|uniref:Uncharacterized protein n=1 Tax=Epicoccum nigrum TaxID=105696 RepID=A0A1Y2LVY7_EPING|nr:hypothetical protein B5807_06522 [Epicoccum nigrum]
MSVSLLPSLDPAFAEPERMLGHARQTSFAVEVRGSRPTYFHDAIATLSEVSSFAWSAREASAHVLHIGHGIAEKWRRATRTPAALAHFHSYFPLSFTCFVPVSSICHGDNIEGYNHPSPRVNCSHRLSASHATLNT